MYKTVDYYTTYGDLDRMPVDLYLFNFTSQFSTSIFTNPFPIEGRGASHSDDLLYLFRYKAYDPLFTREAPEIEMKNFIVRYMVEYVKHGVSALNKASPCRRGDMENGFCEYLDIQRNNGKNPNRLKVSVKSDFDMEMVNFNKEIDRIVVHGQ